MFVCVWLQTEVCRSETNAEWSNKSGDGWFPELYANQSSLTLSSKCNCLLNVTSWTHTHKHRESHARDTLNKKQQLLVCDIITPAGETQERQVRVIPEWSLSHTGKGEIIERAMWDCALCVCVCFCTFACNCVSVCLSGKLNFLQMTILQIEQQFSGCVCWWFGIRVILLQQPETN